MVLWGSRSFLLLARQPDFGMQVKRLAERHRRLLAATWKWEDEREGASDMTGDTLRALEVSRASFNVFSAGVECVRWCLRVARVLCMVFQRLQSTYCARDSERTAGASWTFGVPRGSSRALLPGPADGDGPAGLGGLPNHQVPSDPQICALSLQIPLEHHEIL